MRLRSAYPVPPGLMQAHSVGGNSIGAVPGRAATLLSRLLPPDISMVPARWRRKAKLLTSLLGTRRKKLCWPLTLRVWIDPAGKANPLARARASLKALGYNSPGDALAALNGMPAQVLHAAPFEEAPAAEDHGETAPQTDEDVLLAALVLGRCSGSIYDPAHPVIWTLGRLSRRLELYQPGGFYGED